jgi:mannan endo-1,4-beta-mannosidase
VYRLKTDNMKKQFLLLTVLLFLLGACAPKPAEHSFIKVNADGQFVRDGKPYYFVGTNFWYGAILGSEGEGGNRERLHKELDFLKSIGINNLRVLVGADGENGIKTRVEPSLQVAPGVYNDTILAGLDYFMNELRERDMTAVLYLNNSWEWSGGYSVYLQWSGHGDAVVPAVDGWPAYMEYVKQFPQSDSAKALFANHVNYIVSRTNRYNQIKYVDDPTIMSWQIGNEPRAFSDENKEPFARWMADVAAQIKSLDPNHMVSSGSEGSWGCEMDMNLFEKIHADPNINYLNIHIWPYNWSWVKADSLKELLPRAKENTKKYIDDHMVIARKYSKPIVLEEFGFPRDGFSFSKEAPTTARDEYYRYVFDLIRQDRESGGLFAGCNFWAWGGFAGQNPGHVFWEKGDDYTGDPAQEQQGLNSVFATDSTIEIIKAENRKLQN